MKGISKDSLKGKLKKQSAPARQPRHRIPLDRAYITRLTVTLLAICTVSSLLLALVYNQTKPVIDAHTWEKTSAAMQVVLPADEYAAEEGFTATKSVTSLYRAVSGGETVGYVCEVTSNGFGGAMSLVVGMDLYGKVTGVSVVKHSETKNIGTKVVESPQVLAGFAGLSAPITVNGGGENSFDAVSGATYSSRGVADGVNAALEAAAPYFQ